MMDLSGEQLKGRLRNLANKNQSDARILLRQFLMERFLERLSVSEFRDHFIIKGGTLITAMLGISLRSTMDIDTTITGFNLNEDEAIHIINQIISIDISDGATFKIKKTERIMEGMEYLGIRIYIDSYFKRIYSPLKIDLSTGDVITPGAIEFGFKKMFEEDNILLLTYNLETTLGEKIQTILARGVLNTRMRDFYDIHALLNVYGDNIRIDVLKEAFAATAKKRKTETIIESYDEIINNLAESAEMKKHWNNYQKKYIYASEINYETVLNSVKALCFLLS